MSVRSRSLICAVMLALGDVSIVAASEPEPQPRTTQLQSLAVPGRVGAVLWTSRGDHCTLQVVFPNVSAIPAGMDPRARRRRPEVQVWLLKEDGSSIAPLRRMDIGPKDLRQPYGVEVSFAYPLSADHDAVAVAIRVDGAVRIESFRSHDDPHR